MKVIQKSGIETMEIDQLITCVAQICRNLDVKRLDLFGSFATGTASERSDIDFVVYGHVDHEALEMAVNNVGTLRKIDFFYFDEIENKFLLEDIKKYGIQIY